MNDKCITLKKNKKEKELSSCTFYKTKAKQNLLRDHILVCIFININLFLTFLKANVEDIEEILSKGRQFLACPYYSSRSAVSSSQLVTLPYNLLLHKEMRESLGISLQGNIVIIDEAHNLIESINSMYSVILPSSQIIESKKQLDQYYEKYNLKLKQENLNHIEDLLRILTQFNEFLSKKSSELLKIKSSDHQKKIYSINDFVFDCQIDDINLFQLDSFFERSDLTKKLHGFIEHQEILSPSGKPISAISSMCVVRNFLQSLTNVDSDGRILVTFSSKLFIKLLNKFISYIFFKNCKS